MDAFGFQGLHPASISEHDVVSCRNALDGLVYQADKPLVFRNPWYVSLWIRKGQNPLWNVICRVKRRYKQLALIR
jgi:hypothetical protein